MSLHDLGLWLVRVPVQYIADFLCRWLLVLSLVSWPGRCKNCRTVGCSPTLSSHVTRRHSELRSVEMALKPRSWASSALSPFLLNQESGCLVINLISSSCSVQCSRSVVSDSLQPHGLQHTSLPCPSPTPGVYPNSRPLSHFAVCVSFYVTSDAASQLPTLRGWGPHPPKKNTCDQLEKLSGAEEQWTAVTSESSV